MHLVLEKRSPPSLESSFWKEAGQTTKLEQGKKAKGWALSPTSHNHTEKAITESYTTTLIQHHYSTHITKETPINLISETYITKKKKRC